MMTPETVRGGYPSGVMRYRRGADTWDGAKCFLSPLGYCYWWLAGGAGVGAWFSFLMYLDMMVSASWRWLSLVLVDGFWCSEFFMG